MRVGTAVREPVGITLPKWSTFRRKPEDIEQVLSPHMKHHRLTPMGFRGKDLGWKSVHEASPRVRQTPK